MTCAEWINTFLSIAMLCLTGIIYRLTNTMAKITEDDKQEKIGHNLSITLPTLLLGKNENTGVLENFCIVNHKNRMEAVYLIYVKETANSSEINFWFANDEPIMIPPYGCYYASKNVKPSLKMFDIEKVEIYAVTNDCTVILNKNIDCYSKPLEKED